MAGVDAVAAGGICTAADKGVGDTEAVEEMLDGAAGAGAASSAGDFGVTDGTARGDSTAVGDAGIRGDENDRDTGTAANARLGSRGTGGDVTGDVTKC